MQLKQIHLKNFCQYQESTINFDLGLNLILGPNGSGKSNLIEAVQFAITGDLQKHTREEAICQSAGSKDVSGVTLDFQHLDYTISVYRGIRPATHTLTCTMRGSTDYTANIEGYTEVNKYLLELLDIQKKQLDDYVFIAQGSLDALISKTKEQRTLELAKVFGVADTERIWESLGAKVTKIEVPAAPDLVTLEAQQYQVQKEVDAIAAQLENASSTQLSEDTKRTFEASLNKRKVYEEHLIKYFELRDKVEPLEQQLTQYAGLPEDQKELEQLGVAKAATESATFKAQELLQEWAAYGQYQKQLNTLVTQQEKLEAKIKSREPVYIGYNATLKRAKEEYITLTIKLADCHNEIAAAQRSIRDAVCVTCKRPFDNYDQIKAALAELEQLEQQLLGDIVPQQVAMDLSQERAFVRDAITCYRNAVNNVQIVPEPAKSIHECEVIINDADIAKYEYNQKQDYINKEQLKEAELHGRYTTISEQLAAIKQFIIISQTEGKYLVVNRRQHTDIVDLLDLHNNYIVQEAELFSIDQQKQFELKRITIEFKEALNIVATRQKLVNTREYLVSLRELFHRSGLPKMMIEAYIDVLAEDVNEFLTIFDAPFKVKRGEHLGFDAVFAGQSIIVPDRLLSGGQKIILSLAFRVALNSRFTSALGLLSLDEPTVHLDKETRACMPIMLERLREVCQLKNIQVLFITHDDDLINLGDNIIQLGVARV